MKLHAARKFSVTQRRKIQETEEQTGAKLSKKLQISKKKILITVSGSATHEKHQSKIIQTVKLKL